MSAYIDECSSQKSAVADALPVYICSAQSFLFRKNITPPLGTGSPWPAVCLYTAVYSCAAGSGASEAIFRHGPRHSGEGCCMWTGGSPIVLPRASIGVEKACNGPVHRYTNTVSSSACIGTCTIEAQSVYVHNIIKGRLHANDATEGGNSTPGARSPVRGPAVWAVDALVGSGPVSVAVGCGLWLWLSRAVLSRGRGREKKTLLVKGTSVLVRRKTRVESNKVRTGAAGEPLKNKKTAYIMVASDIGRGNFVIGGRPCIYNIPCGHGRPRALKGTADVGRERFSQNRP